MSQTLPRIFVCGTPHGCIDTLDSARMWGEVYAPPPREGIAAASHVFACDACMRHYRKTMGLRPASLASPVNSPPAA
jgi:hypothetical protein